MVPANVLAPFAQKTCLVTGGLGFIGSNIALALVRAGAHVIVLDSLVPRHGANRRHLDGEPVEVVVADIADSTPVASLVARAEYVFNLAGQLSHIDSMEDPLGDLELNARCQLAFLETLRRVNPDAVVVYASTRQVYGRPRYLPVDEAHPIEPVDINGICKYAAEQFHLLYARTYGLPVCALRLTNVYGPRQRLLGDHQAFVPVFLGQALQDQRIVVYGEGHQQRDLLHVDDCVAAFLLAAQNPAAIGCALNLSHDTHTSISEVAHMVVEACGAGCVEYMPWPCDRKRIEIGDYFGDAGKARTMLGWKPTIPLKEGIADTVEYYRSRISWYL